MKAKITPRKEMVLLYRPEQADAQEKLPQLLEEMGIEYRLVVQEELSMWTGELAGYLHRTPEQAEREDYPPLPAAMAMGGLNSRRLDQLLKGVAAQGVSLPIKMVITPHNERWEFGQLIQEVSQEHALFMAMERLKRLSDRASRLPAADEEIRLLIKQSKELLAQMNRNDDRQPSKEELDQTADRLEQLLTK